jgi:hypothetical protein
MLTFKKYFKSIWNNPPFWGGQDSVKEDLEKFVQKTKSGYRVKYRWYYDCRGVVVERFGWLGTWDHIAIFKFGSDAKEYIDMLKARNSNNE